MERVEVLRSESSERKKHCTNQIHSIALHNLSRSRRSGSVGYRSESKQLEKKYIFENMLGTEQVGLGNATKCSNKAHRLFSKKSRESQSAENEVGLEAH